MVEGIVVKYLSRQRYSMNGADLLHNASVACTMLKGQNGARKRTLYQDIYIYTAAQYTTMISHLSLSRRHEQSQN